MRKFILAIVATIFSIGIANAQDLATATERYNQGANALTIGQKAEALKYFQEALGMAKGLGAEAEELVANCKKAIPGVMLSVAKEAYNKKDFAEALTKFTQTQKTAEEYGNKEVADEAAQLIPQTKIAMKLDSAEQTFKENKYNEAILAYKEVLQLDSVNASAILGSIQALCKKGDFDEAKKMLDLAKKIGQGENASKVIGTALLQLAATNLQKGKFADAIKKALDADNFVSNPKAYQIAGVAALKLKNNKDAIKYFSKYIQGDPKARNAGQIALQVGALYQGEKNKAKAIEYYKIAKSYGIDTQKYIDALSK